MPMRADLIERFADDCAFLVAQRLRLARHPGHGADVLQAHDARIEAALDGLRLAGPAAGSAVVGLAGKEAGGVFALAVLAAEGDAALAGPLAGLAHGAAFEFAALWLGAGALPTLRAWAVPAHPLRRFGILGCAAIERGGAIDPTAFSTSDPALRDALARAVLLRGDRAAVRHLLGWVGEAEAHGRRAAEAAALLLRDRAAIDRLRREAAVGDPVAAALAARCGGLAAAAWARGLPSGAAIAATAAIGDAGGVPWLIERLTQPALARSAAVAIAALTGVQVAERFAAPAPAEPSDLPNDDPADANVELPDAAAMPWPDAARIAAWWSAEGGAFAPGTRLVAGVAPTTEALTGQLGHGPMAWRQAAATELVLAAPGPLARPDAPLLAAERV